jgi:hypothetical protein
MRLLPRFRVLRSPAAGRALGLARRAVDLFPLTPLGLVTSGAAALALVRYGVARVDLLYLVIGAVGLGLAGLSLALTTLGAIRVRLALRRGARKEAAPLRLECGVAASTGFSVPALWYLPMVSTRWSWTRPRGAVQTVREGGRLVERVTPERRGHEESIERRVEVSDAFALARVAFLHREPRAVRALPSTGTLDRLTLARTVAGGDDTYDPLGTTDGERLDLRGYVPGDPTRFMLWKVFAKTRQLVVRTPERAQSPARRSVAYLVTGPGDEAAAGVTRRAVETGALGPAFVLGADGTAETARTPDEAMELIARSASATDGGAGLAPFLTRAAGTAGTRALVFVPASRGPWVDHVLAAARARPGRVPMQILVCADGLDRRRPPSLPRRLLLGASDAGASPAPPAREVERLIDALAATGAEVVLVDRVHGRTYSGAAMAAARGATMATPPDGLVAAQGSAGAR